MIKGTNGMILEHPRTPITVLLTSGPTNWIIYSLNNLLHCILMVRKWMDYRWTQPSPLQRDRALSTLLTWLREWFHLLIEGSLLTTVILGVSEELLLLCSAHLGQTLNLLSMEVPMNREIKLWGCLTVSQKNNSSRPTEIWIDLWILEGKEQKITVELSLARVKRPIV